MEKDLRQIVEIYAKSDLTVLNRILVVLRKRRLRVESLKVNFNAGGKEMCVILTVDPSQVSLSQLRFQLEKLLEVESVRLVE